MSYDSQTSTSLINKLRKDVDSLTLKIAVLTDSKASGTSGGTGVATTWTTRELNTIAIDPNGLILDLTANQFTLAAGAYQIRAMAAFRHTGHTRMRIYDVTGSAEATANAGSPVDVIIGYSVSSDVSNQANTYIDLNLRVQPHKDNVYRLEYYISAAGADHLGVAAGLTGIPEIYAICEITRLDTGLTKPSGGSGIQGAPGPAGPVGPAGPPGPSGGGTVTDVSVVTANGVSGSVATSTTTPAITLALGAITPTSVASTGTVTGTNLSGTHTGTSSGTNTGDQTITLTGPVTGSGTGSFATTITNGAVTYDKIQTTSAIKRLLGSDGTGTSIGEIILGSNLSMTGNTLSASAPGTGTVTSVNADGSTTGMTFTGGPVTTSGTLTLGGTLALTNGGTGATSAGAALTSLGAYPANNPNGYNTGTVTTASVVTANGVSGTVANASTAPAITIALGAITPDSVAATGTVTGSNLTGTSSGTNTGDQAIVLSGDVSGSGSTGITTTIGANKVTYGMIQAVSASSKLLGSSASGTAVEEITLGTNLSMTGSTLNAAGGGGGGTVTSVDVAGGSTGLTTSGGPVTASGTITLGGTLSVANGGTSSTSASSAISFLAGATTNGQYLRGNGTVVQMSAIQAVDLPQIALGGSAVSGTLGVINGGTGQSNVYTDGDILIGNSIGGTLNRNKIVGTAPITVTNGAGTITIGATGIGSGNVVGPASASDGNFVLFDGTTGKLIKGASWNQVNGDFKGPLGYSTMVDGFVYIPSGPTAPSNTPTNAAIDNVPMFFHTNNSTNTNVLYIHNGFAWKSVALA